MSNSLRPHGRQHVRLFCPSLSPGLCWDSCPLSRCCYLTISSSAVTFSFCLQSFLASGSFPMSWLFASGGQSNGASPLVLPMNIQGWFPLGLTGFISLQSKGCSRVFSRTTTWKHQFFSTQPSSWSNLQICTWLLEKPQLWLYGPWSMKWCLCFYNILSRFVKAFFLRSKCLLISWLTKCGPLEKGNANYLFSCLENPMNGLWVYV